MSLGSRPTSQTLKLTSLLLVLQSLAFGWGTRPVFGQALAQSGGTSKAAFDPAKNLQALSRLLATDEHSHKDNDASRMMQAYYCGKPTAVGRDGNQMPFAAILKLATCDWTQQEAEKAYPDTPQQAADPFISVTPVPQGRTVGCAPIEIANGLWCTVDIKVIDLVHERAHELDYLVGNVTFFGGKQRLAVLTEPPSLLREGVLVDFWSETNADRLTLSCRRSDGSSLTADVYGPLFYRVLSRPPEFILIGNRKLVLPPQFRKACTEICQKVDAERADQGLPSPPVFRLIPNQSE